MSKVTFSDPYAPVEIEPIMTSEGLETKRQIIKVRDDEGKLQPVSDVSRDYQVITNEAAFQIVQDVQSRSEYTWQEMKNFFDGKRYYHYSMSEQEVGKVNNGISRTVRVGILAKNSYDGSCRFGIQLFMAMYECTNQFIHPNMFGNFLMRHTQGAEGGNLLNAEDAAQQISRGAGTMVQMLPAIQSLKKSDPLSLSLLQQAQQGVAIAPSKWGSVLSNIEADNEWGLLNAMTFVASHELAGGASLRAGESIGRFFLDKREGEVAEARKTAKSN